MEFYNLLSTANDGISPKGQYCLQIYQYLFRLTMKGVILSVARLLMRG